MIEMTDIHKSFGEKVIYRGLNLSIRKGETHAVIGRSGEGKSVLLKHLCGLLAPDRGEVVVDGVKVDMNDKDSLRHIRKRVTMVFQMGALFDSLTVRENVGFFQDNLGGMEPAAITRLCDDLLDEVNLPGTGHLLPAELSGGMRKRVGLARALAVQPEIILYDEPTTGLDPVTTDVIGELIQKTSRAHGVTSVVVTHDMKSAYKVADRISMLYEGEIVFSGTPSQIQDSENPVVHQFIHGYAHGPITETEEERLSRLSTEMMHRSQMVRRIKSEDMEP